MKSASKMISRIGAGLLLSVGLFNLAGCGEDFNLSLSQYKIENLKHKGTYVGLPNEEVSSSKPKLPAEIKISYSSNSGRLPVFLNGQTVSQHLIYSNTEASLETAKIADLLRQGVNTLSVAPLSFGPQATFSFDNAGPFIDVLNAESNNGYVDVSLRVKDTTTITSVSIQAMDYQWDGEKRSSVNAEERFLTDDGRTAGYIAEAKATKLGSPSFFTKANDGTWNANIQQAKLYKIVAEDAYGFETVDYYLAPEEKINNVFKLRLAKSVLDNATGMLVPMMESVHVYAPQTMADFNIPNPTEQEAKTKYSGYDYYDAGAEASSALDGMSAWWRKDAIFMYQTVLGVSKFGIAKNESDCGYTNIERDLTQDDFVCTSTFTKDGVTYCQSANLESIHGADVIKSGACSRAVLYRMQIDKVGTDGYGDPVLKFSPNDKKVGQIDLDVSLVQSELEHGLYTDMGIKNVECKPKFATQDICVNKVLGVCWDNRKNSLAIDPVTKTPLENKSIAAHSVSGEGFCQITGDTHLTDLLGNTPSMNFGLMQVKAHGANPKGALDMLISNGKLSLGDAGLSLNLKNPVDIGGMGLTLDSGTQWLSDLIISPLGTTIVMNVLQDNMKDFILGFDLKPDPDIYVDDTVFENPEDAIIQMQAQAHNVWTNADNNEATPLNWYMYYSGFFKATQDHPALDSKVLGSRYVMNAVEMPVETEVGGLDLAVNVNFINQALMSLYRSGMSHITVTNRKFDDAKGNGTNVHFGPGITNTFAMKNNDIRVQLVPRGPGELEMKQGGNGVQGTLYYRNAKMLVETYSKGSWTRNFTMEVDMKIGVLMTAEDQKFQIKILGMPELDINKIALGKSDDYIYNNESESVNIFLNNNAVRGVVQFAVDLVLNLAVPQMAMKIGEIDYPGIAVPKTDENGDYIVDKGIWMTTESIEANNGAHLSFGIGMDFDKECTVKEGIQLDETGKPELTFCDAD